jgi:hypothetical protein
MDPIRKPLVSRVLGKAHMEAVREQRPWETWPTKLPRLDQTHGLPTAHGLAARSLGHIPKPDTSSAPPGPRSP